MFSVLLKIPLSMLLYVFWCAFVCIASYVFDKLYECLFHASFTCCVRGNIYHFCVNKHMKTTYNTPMMLVLLMLPFVRIYALVVQLRRFKYQCKLVFTVVQYENSITLHV